jgi:hypothetical protein
MSDPTEATCGYVCGIPERRHQTEEHPFTDQHRIDRILVLEERVRVLEAAVPEDPWVDTTGGECIHQCYWCRGRWPKHDPDCAWLAARGEP